MGSQVSVEQSISFDKLPLTDDIPRVKNSDGSVLYGPIKKKYTFSNGVRFWKAPGYLGDIPILTKCNETGEYLRSAVGFTSLFRKNRPACWYDNSTNFATKMSNAWTDEYYISVGDRRFYEGLAFGVAEPPKYNAKSPIGKQFNFIAPGIFTKKNTAPARAAAAAAARAPAAAAAGGSRVRKPYSSSLQNTPNSGHKVPWFRTLGGRRKPRRKTRKSSTA